MNDLMEIFEELRDVPPSPRQQEIRAQFLQAGKQRQTSITGYIITGIAASLVLAFAVGIFLQRPEKPTAQNSVEASIPFDQLVEITPDNLHQIKPLVMLETGGTSSFEFSSDSLTLITVEENHTGSLWDLTTDSIQPATWTTNPVYDVAAHPDEPIIAYLTDKPDSIFEYNRETGEDQRKQVLPSNDNAFVYDEQGKLVVFSNGIHRVVWDDGTESIGLRRLKDSFPGDSDYYALSPDGQYIVQGECLSLAYIVDTCMGRLGLWDISAANSSPVPLGDPLPSLINNAVTFTPDSQFVVMKRCLSPRTVFSGENLLENCDQHDMVIWDLAETMMTTLPSTCEQITTFSTIAIDDITVSLSCDERTELWNVDMRTGNSTLLHTLSLPASDFSLSPDGRLISFINNHGSVEIWGVTTETSR